MTKLDARGSTVLFSTYIGGSGVDEARGMTIDTLGNVYVVGSTTSTNFPTVSPRQAALAGESDGFLLRISTTGGGLGFSTYFGGTDVDEVNAIAVDAARSMYVAARRDRADFPLLNADPGLSGSARRVRQQVRPRPAPSSTRPTTAARGIDTLEGIGVDAAGNVNTTGSTTSTNLPVLNAGRPADQAAASTRSSRASRPTGSLVFCSYFGGSGNDAGRAVAVMPAGCAFIGGSTTSPDFPVAAPLQPAFGGGMDAFLLVLSPTGALAWSTYYGGTRSERGRALALNAAGKLIFAGQTFSPDMPLHPAGAAAHRRQPRHVRRGARSAVQRRSPTPRIWAAATTTRAAASPSTASGACSPPAPRPIRRPGALGASDAFIYGISSGLAGVDTDGDGLDDEWETQFGTDPETNDAAADPDGDGFTNAQERANNTHPTGYFTRFLAEGSTGAFFDDRIALFNPGVDLATVVLRFQRDAGAEIQQVLAIPVAQPRHGQPRDDRRPRERRLRDRRSRATSRWSSTAR